MKRSLPTAVLLIGLCGCGSGTQAERVVVSGKVTFAGKPVTGGSIRIVSANESATTASSRCRRHPSAEFWSPWKRPRSSKARTARIAASCSVVTLYVELKKDTPLQEH